MEGALLDFSFVYVFLCICPDTLHFDNGKILFLREIIFLLFSWGKDQFYNLSPILAHVFVPLIPLKFLLIVKTHKICDFKFNWTYAQSQRYCLLRILQSIEIKSYRKCFILYDSCLQLRMPVKIHLCNHQFIGISPIYVRFVLCTHLSLETTFSISSPFISILL